MVVALRTPMPKSFTLKTLNRIECRHSTLGELPDGPGDPNVAVYRSFISEWNAKRCDAMAADPRVLPLLKVRSFLLRGRIRDASALVHDLKQSSHGDLELGEILLEEAKVAVCESEWLRCLELTAQGLALACAPVTRLSLAQTRALAYFESGDLWQASAELEACDSLGEIFPRSPSFLYARILRAKILARDTGPGPALLALSRIWEDLASQGRLDPDNILTLLRAEIDVLRVGGKPHLSAAVAAHGVAGAIGDRLYQALALVDCYFAGSDGLRASLQGPLQRAAAEFGRVRRLMKETASRSGTGISQTARTIREWEAGIPSRSLELEADFPQRLQASAFLFADHGQLVRLSPWSVHPLRKDGQLVHALSVLGAGTIPRVRLFSELWPREQYVPKLHDARLSSLLTRIRGLGIQVASGPEAVRVPGLLAVEHG
jgi:hypothetical protein